MDYEARVIFYSILIMGYAFAFGLGLLVGAIAYS